MSVKFLYSSAFGRLVCKFIQKSGVFHIAAWYLKSPLSKPLIRNYISKNNIPMDDFPGVRFKSFADFFGRQKSPYQFDQNPKSFISPCDSLLNIFKIKPDCELPIKESLYKVSDLIPNEDVAGTFAGGMCFIFRLCASDYHHFCYVDDCEHTDDHFIQGMVHSVQPIACASVPVYRLNRRQWTILNTQNFGPVAQIEVGALLVGGMIHEKNNATAKKGEEMGKFDLCGSTIVLLITKETAENLVLNPDVLAAMNGETEVRVKLGQTLGKIN